MRKQLSDRPCKMTYHNAAGPIAGGDYMRSVTLGYRVTEARLVRGHTDKWALTCLRCYPNEIPTGAVVHPIRWFSRSKKK